MRKLKLITLLLIISLLVGAMLPLTSCTNGKGGNIEDGGNGNVTPTPTPGNSDKELVLVEDGKANFQIVYGRSVSRALNDKILELVGLFNRAGVKVDIVKSEQDYYKQDCEVLVGEHIDFRDEYNFDSKTLGRLGYMCKVQDDKVLVKGGSDESTVKAFGLFMKDVLKVYDENTDLKNITIKRDTCVVKKEEYVISDIKIGTNSVKDYVICYDEKYDYTHQLAQEIQYRIYCLRGYWLDIKPMIENPKNAIILSVVDEIGEDGYRVRVVDNNLLVECENPQVIKDSTIDFMDKFMPLDTKTDIILENGFIYSENIDFITYCGFGKAFGDGLHDDFYAIKKTHDRANRTGQKVIADKDCTFHMGAHGETIVIKTDVDWQNALFIIDDSRIAPATATSYAEIFTVLGDSRNVDVNGIAPFKCGMTNVGMKFDTPVSITMMNSNVRHYIRYGNNANAGSVMRDTVVVDKDGNIEPGTSILWDFDEYTSVSARTLDDKPITISGGTFKTIANKAPREYTYYHRGINIRRDNVTVTGLSHYIEGEGPNGAPYAGFLNINSCNNVLIENTKLTAHKRYECASAKGNYMGSYDMSASGATNVTWDHVEQTNSIWAWGTWGIMGSNFCKNLTLNRCKLSRFDAHQGVCNATITNSYLSNINAIGGGTLTVENTKVYSSSIINFRGDYGSLWKGDIILRNVTVKSGGDITVVGAGWYNHDFGYPCYIPQNIVIDGINVEVPEGKTKGKIYVLPNYKMGVDQEKFPNGSVNKNPLVLTKKITITEDGNEYRISRNEALFKDTEYTILKKEQTA